MMIKYIPKYTLIAIGLFYCSLAYADSRDSIDEIAYRRQLDRLKNESGYYFEPFEQKAWHRKQQIKGSWRWSIDEWELLEECIYFDAPEYYYDEELHASNNGWLIG